MIPTRTAFILGAGLGTRLRPLTNRRPKPLIPVAGKPLIAHAFDHLIDSGIGIGKFVVNTHWCAERYAEFFPNSSWRGVPIAFVREEPEVLETAGGIWNAREHLRDAPFIVYNGDILSDLPLARVIEHHQSQGNEVTLVLRSTDGNRNVAFDAATHRVLDLRRELRPDIEPRHAFTGIYVVEPSFIERIPPAKKLSVVPIFHQMIKSGAKLGAIVLDEGRWWDLGTRDEYLAACSALGHPQWIAPSAIIGAGAQLDQCQVWENAVIAPGAQLKRCIVTDGAHAHGEAADIDFEPGGNCVRSDYCR